MNKFKLFIENFIVYGIGGIISKIIPFVMLPIVTRIMPNTEFFGISDMSNTIVQFGSAIALMGMYDAAYRMFFEKEDEGYKKIVCSTALSFTICMSIAVFLLMIAFRKSIATVFFDNKQYHYVVCYSAMATLVGATNSIISAPTRMQNKRGLYLIANTLGPLISYSISIPLLLKGYYIIALPLAAVISGFTMEVTFAIINRRWFSLKLFDKKVLGTLLKIAVPLLPNFLIYWVFNSCDKIMITNILGIGAAGIYSAGSKLGHFSQLIYTAFAGGWQYFAFFTMREKNQVETNSRIYEYLGLVSFLATSTICVFSYYIFKILFPAEYITGYIVAPYLFLSPLLLMLYQTSTSQFLVIKKTWPGMLIISAGAIVNVALNSLLIPIIGIEGASIATLCGYAFTCIVDIFVLIRINLMKPRIRFLCLSIGMIVYLILWRFLFSLRIIIGIPILLMFWVFSIVLYKKDLKLLISNSRHKTNRDLACESKRLPTENTENPKGTQ